MADEGEMASPAVQMTVQGADRGFTTLQDLSAFLYDFNLMYETVRLATDPTYDLFRFNTWTANRKGRRDLRPRDRLYVSTLRVGSPFLLVTLLDALNLPVTIPCATKFAAVIELIYLIKAKNNLITAQTQELQDKHVREIYKTRIAKAQAEKLEGEKREAVRQELDRALSQQRAEMEELLRRLEERGGLTVYANAKDRLRRSPQVIVSLEVSIVDREVPKE